MPRYDLNFLHTGEHAAEHDAVAAGGQSLDDVAAVADAAVGYERHIGAFQGLGHVIDG